MDSVIDGLRKHIDACAAETRRHIDVKTEPLLVQLQLLAEELTVLDQRLDHLQTDVRDVFRP